MGRAGSHRGKRGSARPHPARRTTGRSGTPSTRSRTQASPRPDASPAPHEPAGPFRLGAVPGATPGRWIDLWHERMPHTRLELIALSASDARRALVAGEVDMALLRLPVDRTDLHVIALYDEVPVVVMPTDSELSVVDELTAADLEGQILVTPADDVLAFSCPGTHPARTRPETTADAVATVAAGVGVTVVPMSLARLHHRRDLTYRPLREGPLSPIGLAWVAERTTASTETFVGIVRGRTARSSR